MDALRGKLIKGSGSWGKLIERSGEAGGGHLDHCTSTRE